jgi:hypothetical protein
MKMSNLFVDLAEYYAISMKGVSFFSFMSESLSLYVIIIGSSL